jgi:hypothetical protein
MCLVIHLQQTRYMNTSRQNRNNAIGGSYQVNGEARLLVHAKKEPKQNLGKGAELLLGKISHHAKRVVMVTDSDPRHRRLWRKF